MVFVEWGDAIEGLLPDSHLQVELSLPDGDERREIGLTGSGPSWRLRWPRVLELTAPWRI